MCVICSVVSDSFATQWTIALQAPLSMEFSRQEYWSGLPFSSPGDLPDPGIEPRFPAFAGWLFTIWATKHQNGFIFSFWSGSPHHLSCLAALAEPLRLCKSQWGEERRHTCPVLSERIQPQVWCWTQVFGDAWVEEIPVYSCIFYWEFLSQVGVEFCQVPFCIWSSDISSLVCWYDWFHKLIFKYCTSLESLEEW